MGAVSVGPLERFGLALRSRESERCRAQSGRAGFIRPQFDLIEPGRTGRGEMHGDGGMRGKKLRHPRDLIGGKIVHNEVNLFSGRLGGYHFKEKGNKLCTGVPGGSLPMTRPCAHLQGRIKRESAMAVTLQNRGARPVRGRETGQGRADPKPEWRSFRRGKKPPRWGAA